MQLSFVSIVVDELEAPHVVSVVRSSSEAALGKIHEIAVGRRSIETETGDLLIHVGVAEGGFGRDQRPKHRYACTRTPEPRIAEPLLEGADVIVWHGVSSMSCAQRLRNSIAYSTSPRNRPHASPSGQTHGHRGGEEGEGNRRLRRADGKFEEEGEEIPEAPSGPPEERCERKNPP